MIEKKYPLKELPKCFGDPEPECVLTEAKRESECALEPACSNHYLFLHEKKAKETQPT